MIGTDEIIMMPFVNDYKRWCIYRENRLEITFSIFNNKIAKESHWIRPTEIEYIEKYILEK